MNNEKFNLTPKIAYLTGVIIGDGNLSSSIKSQKNGLFKDYKIKLDLSDKKYLIFLFKLFKSLIKTKTKPRKSSQRGNRIPRLNIEVRNKGLYYFFNKTMEIPIGAKSSIVFIPTNIKNSSKTIKKYFLAGYFDTDGGFRGNSLGFTTASKKLNKEVSNLLKEFDILHSTEMWINKKYNKEFYGIKIKKDEIDKLLKAFPLQNKEKLNRINQRFMRGCRSGQTGMRLI